MKNSDKPIYPIADEQGYVGNLEVILKNCNNPSIGLTKREYFAAMAMQGLLSADARYKGRTDNRESLAKDAIAQADELLKQLDQ